MTFRAVVSVWRSNMHIFILAFRATFINFRRSEPLFIFGLACRAILSFFNSTFRVVVSVWHSNPHIFKLAFRAIIHFGLAFRAIMSFFNSAFRAMFSVRQSKSLFQFSVQSRHSLFGIQSPLFTVKRLEPPSLRSLEFRASLFTVSHLEPLASLVFRAKILAFRVVILFQFSVQSHIASIQSCHFLLV